MTRIILIVLEILVGVAAIGGEAYMILSSRRVLNAEPGLTPAKTRVIIDLVLLDVIVAIMMIAAWQVVTNGPAARWLSIVAGVVVAVIAAARPTLSGSRQAVSSAVAVLGLVVVLLSIFLPSPG